MYMSLPPIISSYSWAFFLTILISSIAGAQQRNGPPSVIQANLAGKWEPRSNVDMLGAITLNRDGTFIDDLLNKWLKDANQQGAKITATFSWRMPDESSVELRKTLTTVYNFETFGGTSKSEAVRTYSIVNPLRLKFVSEKSILSSSNQWRLDENQMKVNLPDTTRVIENGNFGGGEKGGLSEHSLIRISYVSNYHSAIVYRSSGGIIDRLRDAAGFFDYRVTFKIPKDAKWAISATSENAGQALLQSKEDGGWPPPNGVDHEQNRVEGEYRYLMFSVGYGARVKGQYRTEKQIESFANDLQLTYAP